MKDKYLVVKLPTAIAALTSLFGDVAKLDPTLEKRSLAFLRASLYVVDLGERAPDALLQAARMKQPLPPAEPDIGFLKVRIADAAVHEKLVAIFREVFGLSRVRADYLMRVTLTAYLVHLRAALETPPEAPAVDRLSLNLALSRLLADFSPEAEKKIGKIAEILKEESTWA